jgi:hypothetical protein
MVGNLDYRTRERIVLFSGAAAIAFVGLDVLTAIAGHPLGTALAKIGSLTVSFYLCARIAGHALTLAEHAANERLARFALYASPVIFLVLVVQTFHASTPNLSLVGFTPHLSLGPGVRFELTCDLALFALFLVTCMAVWVEESSGVSASLTRVSYVVVTLFSLAVLGLIWGTLKISTGLARTVASLFVLAVVGWLLVAILRRVERLDENPPDGPASPLPVAPVAPAAPQSLTPQP